MKQFLTIFDGNFNNVNKFLTILKCSIQLDFEFNDTVNSCRNRTVYAVDFCSLAQFKRLNIFKALTSETTSINI